ncbi:MAG: M14-type cytosolic carboxypeptidase [Polyangiaceae bacterium]|nr:M14-type cytosolic carboxypeptidase [Polyangiaceae bacterium]
MRHCTAMEISADICGGSIQVVQVLSKSAVEIALRKDSAADLKQWFHWKARAPRGAPAEYRIVNANEAGTPQCWENYQALASYDRARWFRVPTTFDGRTLVIRHAPAQKVVYYAYFAAYPMERHRALVARAEGSRRARVTSVGKSLEQQPIDVIEVGKVGGPRRKVWIITRQHAGETQGAWLVEGLLGRLLDERDGLADALLDRAIFYIVPNMNPDGSARGNFRTNVAGRDLNREWSDPGEQTSPEVACVKRAMHETGVDLFLDFHGEETAPCAFAIGCEGNPSYSARQRELERRFCMDLASRDRHFWPDYGYGPDDPGKGDLRIGNNFIGEEFDCLSITVELPFKEGGLHPVHGGALSFSPDVAMHLGRVSLETIGSVIDEVRGENVL